MEPARLFVELIIFFKLNTQWVFEIYIFFNIIWNINKLYDTCSKSLLNGFVFFNKMHYVKNIKQIKKYDAH